MRVKIIIEVEAVSDLYTALTELRKNVKKECKRLKLNPHKDSFDRFANLDDNNCYGDVVVRITNPKN